MSESNEGVEAWYSCSHVEMARIQRVKRRADRVEAIVPSESRRKQEEMERCSHVDCFFNSWMCCNLKSNTHKVVETKFTTGKIQKVL